LLLALISMVVLMSASARPLPPETGPRITVEEARAMPENWPGGRTPFFERDPLRFYFTSRNAGLRVSPAVFALSAAAILLVAAIRGNVLPMEAWALLGVSLADFLLAHAMLFMFYLPNRYVRYVLPVFAMMWLAATLPPLVSRLRRLAAGVTGLFSGPRSLGATASLIIVALSMWTGAKIVRQVGEAPPAGQEEAYAFIRSLPKDTLVAAHPVDANAIPLRTRRSVVASRETSIPYYAEYYRRATERTSGELQACYASDFGDVDRLHTIYGADVFLVNLLRYKQRGWRCYAPLDDASSEWFERGRREGFVLLHPPPDRVLFRQGDYTVIRLGPPRGPFRITSADTRNGGHG